MNARGVVASVALCLCQVAALADDSHLEPAALKAVKRATVYLRVTFANGSVAQGSGFFAGEPNLVVTNAHVVGMRDPQSPYPQRIDVVVNSGQDEERSYLGEVAGVDPERDLTVIRVTGEDLPPPLPIASGRELEETQTVFIFGFPLGTALGKQISVSKTSVSSLRRNEAGDLEWIQVNGGMHPGNSGGPVVDARGEVVGVAAAVVRNTQIHLAVPGEAVQHFLDGRIGSVSVGRPRAESGKLIAVVRVLCTDPMSRIRSVSLDYWLGTKGKARPASTTAPDAAPGDTPHQSLALRLVEGVGEGKWTIPLAGERQVIWGQPHYVLKSGEERWATATILRPPPPEHDDAPAGAPPVREEQREAEAQKELKALEGDWKLVRREVSGAVEDISGLKWGLMIEDGKMIWTRDQQATGLEASIELDPTTKPRKIDMELTGPRQRGEQRLGIYELRGNKLVICWNKGEDPRPRKFTTRLSLGCGTVCETYQRLSE